MRRDTFLAEEVPQAPAADVVDHSLSHHELGHLAPSIDAVGVIEPCLVTPIDG